jgi:hypothetical protein
VEDFDAFDPRGLFEPFDACARLGPLGVAARGEHDAGRGVFAPLDVNLAEAAAGDGVEDRIEVGAEADENGLRLGVAEAHVVFEHARPLARQHQADEEHAAEIEAVGARAFERRLDDLADAARQRLFV